MINTQQTLRCQLTALADFACGPSSGLELAELRAIANEFYISTHRIEEAIAKRAGNSDLTGVFG
jgi:hypothetical protein